MGDGAADSACSGPELGKFKVDTNSLFYCDGSNWIILKIDKALPACTGTNKMRYDVARGEIMFCSTDGWDWGTSSSSGATVYACALEVTQGSCDALPACHWNAGVCADCLCKITP